MLVVITKIYKLYPRGISVMKKLLVTTLLAFPMFAHAGGYWVDEPDIKRAELQERYRDRPEVVTDPRYCTQYIIYASYSTGAAVALRVDQNGEPAKAHRCVPTDPAPEKVKQQQP